jgi:hypothetical protein
MKVDARRFLIGLPIMALFGSSGGQSVAATLSSTPSLIERTAALSSLGQSEVVLMKKRK